MGGNAVNPRVAVITSGYLPVPNVLGGAVEALDMMMVQENEKTRILISLFFFLGTRRRSDRG